MAHVASSTTATAPIVRGQPLPTPVYEQLLASGLSREQIQDVCMAVEDGVVDLRTYLGITDEVLATIESMALQFYRQGLFMYASIQYTFVVDVDDERASGWRGLGASLLALGQTERALIALCTASLKAPDDLVARFLLGEAQVAARRGAEAKRTLERAIALAGQAPALTSYVRRARATLDAQDLAKLVPPADDDGSSGGGSSAGGAGRGRGEDTRGPGGGGIHAHGLPPADRLPTPEEAARMSPADIERHPATRALFARLLDGVERHAITLKDVAGMSDEQMVGAYNAGCGYLEVNEPIAALRIAGWLLFFDSTNALYYRLAGVAAQQMQWTCLADYMFGLALIYAPGDPTCEIYRGEVKMFSDEREAGVALIRGALPKLGADAFSQTLAARGQALLKLDPGAQEAAR